VHDGHVALAAGYVAHTFDVDLQILERKSFQVGEAGETRPEVVERKAANGTGP
jgi:hypothetical protein